MNVAPAQYSPVAADPHESAKPVRAPQPASPVSDNDPAKPVAKPQNSPAVPSVAEDEVKVQWDASAHLMIYQFVNQHSGALVLQVPSREVLNLTRGIHESLQKESLRQESLRQESPQQQAVKEVAKETANKDIARPESAASGTPGPEGNKANGN